MNINRRSLLGLVPVVLIVGTFWFVVLAPTRSELKATQAQVLQAAARRDAATATATAGEQARRSYPRNYASVASLAEAVPPGEDVAALVRGVDSMARANKLDFRTIALGGGEAAAPAKTDAPAATDPPAGTEAPAGAGAGAVAQASAGAAAGSAGLRTMPLTLTAEGGYLALQRFLKALHARAGYADEKLRVDGRLLTIDGFSLLAGRRGFPQLVALISATAYLEPDPGGVIAHSTRRRPASAQAPAGRLDRLPSRG